jgi:hypothetical protein
MNSKNIRVVNSDPKYLGFTSTKRKPALIEATKKKVVK